VAKTAGPVELVGWLLRDDGGANAGQFDGHPPRRLLARAGARWRRYVNALSHDQNDALEAGVEAVKVETRMRAAASALKPPGLRAASAHAPPTRAASAHAPPTRAATASEAVCSCRMRTVTAR